MSMSSQNNHYALRQKLERVVNVDKGGLGNVWNEKSMGLGPHPLFWPAAPKPKKRDCTVDDEVKLIPRYIAPRENIVIYDVENV